LVDTDTESEPEVTPSEVEESQSLVTRVPLMGEEFEASKPSGTRTVSSHSLVSSDSTTPLSPNHPLTHASPTPTPTRVSFHHRTARMAVRTQPTLSPGMSVRIAEASALSPSSFRKRYRSSYETPSPSSSPTLLVRKRYWGTSELIENTEGESSVPDSEREGLEDESSDSNDEKEGHGLDDKGQGLDDEAMSEPLGLEYEAAKRHTLESTEEIAPSTYKLGQSSRSGAVRDEIFSQRYRFRSLEREHEAALWHADLKRKLAEERCE
ncbi:hypothetical protein Tco_1064493, partial [Tanacetum coccineum]